MSNQQRNAKGAAAQKKTIFNAADAAGHLKAIKQAANGATNWWKGVLDFGWAGKHPGNNGTQWVPIEYTDKANVKGRLLVRISGERHIGQIMPNTDQGVADLAARVKNKEVQIKKRDKKPSIQFQKWNAQVKTAEDGVTVLLNAEGKPEYPGDDKLSPYYQLADLVGEAFAEEAKERIDRGTALCLKASTMKNATAQAVLAVFAAEQGPRTAGDMILSSEQVGAIRKLYKSPQDVDLLTKGVIIAPNTKIAGLVQEYISDKAPKNKGLPLPNPMTRVAMNFDKTTGMAQLAFFDKSQPFVVEGKQKYDTGKIDGDPINADNVHQFVLSRSLIDGIVNMDSVCFSNLAISMPVKAEVLVVDKPSGGSVGIDDVYDDDEGVQVGAGSHPDSPQEPAAGTKAAPAQPAPQPPKTPAAPVQPTPQAPKTPAAPPKQSAAPDTNYDGLLDELSGGK